MPLSTCARSRIVTRSHERAPATTVQVSPAQCEEATQPNQHLDKHAIQTKCVACMQNSFSGAHA